MPCKLCFFSPCVLMSAARLYIYQFRVRVLVLWISRHYYQFCAQRAQHYIHNFGLRMGLSHESINRVLDLMDSFPNKIVPPDFLIDIFKVQYN